MVSKQCSQQRCCANEQKTDALEHYELYVPKEAELVVVPEERLPSSVLKRIRKMYSGNTGVLSHMATWISPIVIRERAHPPQDLRGCGVDRVTRARVSSAARGSTSKQPCCCLPISCAHLTAFNVLKQFLPSGQGRQSRMNREKVLPELPPLPPGPVLCFTQDSIIIHCGQIFLCIKSSARSVKRKRELGLLLTSQHAQPHTAVLRKCNPKCRSISRSMEQTPSPSCAKEDSSVASFCPSRIDKLQHSVDWLQKFGITRQVRVVLTKLPEMNICVTPLSQPHLLMDLDSQMSPSGGPLLSESMSHSQDSSQSQYLQKDVLVNDQSKQTAQDCMEPELKKPRPMPFFPLQALGCDQADSETVCGRIEGNVTRPRSPEVMSVCEQEEEGGENQQEVERKDDGKGLIRKCEVRGVEDVSVDEKCISGVQDYNGPLYLSVSGVEDHGMFDFEQLAREERISRIREKIREKEAALKNLASPT